MKASDWALKQAEKGVLLALCRLVGLQRSTLLKLQKETIAISERVGLLHDRTHVQLRVSLYPNEQLLAVGVQNVGVGVLFVKVLASGAILAEAVLEVLVAFLAFVVQVDVFLRHQLVFSVSVAALRTKLASACELKVPAEFRLVL